MQYRQKGLLALITVMLLAVFACFAAKQYSVNLNYSPAFVPKPVTGKGEALRLAMFQDLRQTDEPLIIGKVINTDGTRVRVFPKYKTAAAAITEGVRLYILKSGTLLPPETAPWDLQEKNIVKADRGILIGGSIDELDVSCRDQVPVKKYEAKLKLTLVLADLKKGTIFYRTTAESSSSAESVLFSEERMEEQVNEVLAGAIEKIFVSSEIRQKIEEAWKAQLAPAPPPPPVIKKDADRKLGPGEEPFVNPEEPAPPARKAPIQSKDIK